MPKSRFRHLPAGLAGLILGAILSIAGAAVALAGGGPPYP